MVAIVVGALLLAKNKEPITTDTSLLTPYLSPTLTFLPFWESRGGERGGCEVGVCGGRCEAVCCVIFYARLGVCRRIGAGGGCPKGVGGVEAYCCDDAM